MNNVYKFLRNIFAHIYSFGILFSVFCTFLLSTCLYKFYFQCLNNVHKFLHNMFVHIYSFYIFFLVACILLLPIYQRKFSLTCISCKIWHNIFLPTSSTDNHMKGSLQVSYKMKPDHL